MATGYTFAIVTDVDDYAGIRDLLGVSATTLTQAVVESLPFLPHVEQALKDRVTAWATVVAAGDADTVRLVQAAQYLTAGRIAWFRFQAMQAEEVTSEGEGSARWGYRQGPEWKALALSLVQEGMGLVNRIVNGADAASAPRIHAVVTAGPTKKRRDADDPRELEEWLTSIYPPIVDPESTDW